MDNTTLERMIEELRRERDEIRYAVRILEALAAGKPPRGRPLKLRHLGERAGKPRRPRRPKRDETRRE